MFADAFLSTVMWGFGKGSTGEEVQSKLDFYIQPPFSVIIGASVSNELREMKPPMKSFWGLGSDQVNCLIEQIISRKKGLIPGLERQF